MRRVLVDGKPVDVGVGEAPALILNNPALANVKELKLNRTTSYNLPATGRNLAALGIAGGAGAVSRFPREYHAFEEYRDGVQVIRDGRARVVSVTREAITLSVTWGFSRDAKELLSRKLRDLAPLRVPWNSLTPWAGSSSLYGWLMYDTFDDGETGTSIRYSLPGVRSDKLLSMISEATGVTIDAPYTLPRLWVPCLTRAGGAPDEGKRTVAYARSTRARFKKTVLSWWGLSFQVIFRYIHAPAWTVDRDDLALREDMDDDWTPIVPPSKPVTWFHLKKEAYLVRVFAEARGFAWQPNLQLVVSVDGQEQGFRLVDPVNGVSVGEAAFHLEAGDERALRVHAEVRRLSDGKVLYRFIPDAPVTDVIRVIITRDVNEAEYGSDIPFDITANLPDMTCLDFLSAYCFMNGLYVAAGEGASITLNSLTDLADRPASGGRAPVVNLDRLALTRAPDTISYAFSDYARENWFRYAEDESVTTKADAAITVDDETLAASKDVVTLPFAPSDTVVNGVSGMATIPVFVKDPDDPGNYKFNGDKLKPRVVGITTASSLPWVSIATFKEEMRWEKRLQYQELLRRLLLSPRVVKLKARVSPVDLQEWGEAVPVFYWQGRHWLYVTITAAADGTADVEMVEIGDRDGNE
jgi:hypothetical protein